MCEQRKCRQCSRPAETDRTMCKEHLERMRENQKKRQEKKKSLRICIAGGCYNKTDGRAYCKKCLERIAKAQPHRYKLYKLSETVYHELAASQNYQCAICGLASQPLCVDHNHISEKVRGLLCTRCNSGLGFFMDSSETLLKAYVYLKHYNNDVTV